MPTSRFICTLLATFGAAPAALCGCGQGLGLYASFRSEWIGPEDARTDLARGHLYDRDHWEVLACSNPWAEDAFSSGGRPECEEAPLGTLDEQVFYLVGDVPITFRWIPKGKALLGSPETELHRNREEEREYEYSATGYWLGKYEVTQTQWKAMMASNPSIFDGKKANHASGMDTSQFPVENISWDDCQAFLLRLNGLPDIDKVFGKGAKFRLPHEKEWEYACRGGKGNRDPFYFGSVLNGAGANCFGPAPYGTVMKGPYLRRTSRVGSYAKLAPHPWGLCDMHGNVWEWCDNLHTPGDLFRACRGGAWINDAKDCRAANRGWNTPDERCGYVGMRVACSIAE